MDRELDHALTTIDCTLEGMEAVVQMVMEVDAVNVGAVGYLLINCIASIRKECDVIAEEAGQQK